MVSILCLFRRGAVVKWLERLAVVRKVAGSSPARSKDWKTLTDHPAVNGYLINFREGQRRRKERIGPRQSHAVPKIRWDSTTHPIAPTAIRLRAPSLTLTSFVDLLSITTATQSKLQCYHFQLSKLSIRNWYNPISHLTYNSSGKAIEIDMKQYQHRTCDDTGGQLFPSKVSTKLTLNNKHSGNITQLLFQHSWQAISTYTDQKKKINK